MSHLQAPIHVLEKYALDDRPEPTPPEQYGPLFLTRSTAMGSGEVAGLSLFIVCLIPKLSY